MEIAEGPKKRVYFQDHRGTRILHVDYRGLTDPDELWGVVREASALVRSYPEGSLLVMANLGGVPFNLVVTAIMQQGVAESRPHVRARAVLGLAPEAARSFEVSALLFGSPMARFDDEDSAEEWLLSQR